MADRSWDDLRSRVERALEPLERLLIRSLPSEELHARALRFELDRSSRSGRTARQACITIVQELER
jgi:predicted AAA+ superfamily ATPase